MEPRVIGGKLHTDPRGSLHSFNRLDLQSVRRMYKIKPSSKTVVRAWQGHKQERKWFYVVKGSFRIVLVKPDDWVQPSDDLPYQCFDVSADTPQILQVPGGFLNGFQALEQNSEVVVFSDKTLDESLLDDYRFDQNRWYNW